MKKAEYDLRLEKALDFVEANLARKISLAAISQHAFSSLSHFHRIFYFMTGLTLKEYIRRRRLSKAAIQLVSTQKSILDVALEAQFDNPESFNKAFNKNFGISPREFRNKKPEFQIMRKIELQQDSGITQPDNISLNFIYLPEQFIQGLKTRTTLENNQQALDIPAFFGDVMQNNRLNLSANQKIFGVYSNMGDDEEFDYIVGVLVEKAAASDAEKYVYHLLPAAEYARFTVQGDPSGLAEAWRYIYGSWMPNSGRSRQTGLDFEIYYPEKTDIYIPICSNDTK